MASIFQIYTYCAFRRCALQLYAEAFLGLKAEDLEACIRKFNMAPENQFDWTFKDDRDMNDFVKDNYKDVDSNEATLDYVSDVPEYDRALTF